MMSMKQYQMILKAKNRGLTINEIARSLGHDRKTVRKYYRMDKEEYLRYRGNAAERGKAFAEYRDEILEVYRNHPNRPVYSSGMYDYLLERHGPLPGSERTLRNYLAYLKASGALPRGKGREYKPVAPLPYGKQAQLDFGQETTNLGKAYFVVVVLSRSRYRYVAAQATPFTTHDVIGHLLDAFEYFGGVPETLVLDQDRTMLIAENLGDLVTTQAFTEFVAEQGFTLHACRAADPESKGKVENSVKFVKTNFFSSRTFTDFDELRVLLRRWLARANARICQATKLMPLSDFEANEKPMLRPCRASIFRRSGARERRNVDKQSLIAVGGVRYSVPSEYRLGEVEIELQSERLLVFDPTSGCLIAEHRVVRDAAAPVTDDAHYTDRGAPLRALRDGLLAHHSDSSAWRSFVEGNWNAYHRYYREHARRLERLCAAGVDRPKLEAALARCAGLDLWSAQDLLDAYVAEGGVLEAPRRAFSQPTLGGSRVTPPVVQTRSLDVYADLLEQSASRNGGQA